MEHACPRTAWSRTSSPESQAMLDSAREDTQSRSGITAPSSLPKGTDFSDAKSLDLTPGLTTERLIHHAPTRTPQSQLHWRTPSLLLASFIAGLIAAVSQHCLYQYLHLRPEDRESTKTGLVLCGRAIAYLAKVAFAQCIILCYRQRIWRTFRTHALSIRSIDQLFSGTEDVSLLVNWEAISNAPLVTVMALIVWLLPLATVIASPSALTTAWRPEVDDAFVPVPTLNFSTESYNNWRNTVQLNDGATKKSLMYYNTTDPSGALPGWFDYYDQPSVEARRHVWKNIFSSPLEILNGAFDQEIARRKSCGGAYNCTYSISFIVPGYKCEDVTDTPGGLFNKSVLVPEGENIYYADVQTGDYQRQQFDKFVDGSVGVPIGDIPAHAGDFRFEPEVWIGYAFNTSERLPSNSPFAKNWTHTYEQHIARCILHEARYALEFNFTGPACQINISSETLKPVLGFDFAQTNDGILPTEQWLSPRDDVAKYKKTAAYHAVAEVFREILQGEIRLTSPIPGPTYAMVDSEITKTSLVQRNSEPYPDFMKRLEEQFRNIALTLITHDFLLVTSEESVPVHRTQYRVVFIYDPVRLWLCYGPVIFLTLVVLLIGAWTIWKDGTTFSTGFSRILSTTRNPTLDKISEGACLGNDPFPKDLMRKKLQFGSVQEDVKLQDMRNGGGGYESVGHCAFGDPTEVVPIRKGILYRGLKSARES
ncbi:hypothetical protein BKA66DRAFT_454381 [Pyrenochaeta sp. MPI-SDFR-AT-0127]|nr:hypothetical protein BKA66DRAFT_454381 [Pyrenochaeta sp. MPI-SDFR-AT-0127]